jgi:hypothetical protein
MTEVHEHVEGGLYAARQKIYPREIAGRYQSLRVYAVWALLGLYYLLPWVRWEGRQAVLFDLPARKFHVFALTLWPQDFYFLTWLLVIAALSLFFFTALAGRLFCGYACPQTVWTEVFLWMERWVEGSRSQQMKLAKSPWTKQKLLRRGAKQFLWIAFALWTGFTFVGYFTPITDLADKIAGLSTGPWETFWVLFYGGATYVNAGFMREQVCKYMCPYARFQSAMFDRDTLIISYDERRGEPRGARRKGADHRGQGPRRLRRLHAVRAGLPDRHRHPQGAAVRVHRLRRLHRRLRRGHGQGRLSEGPDPLRHAERPRRATEARRAPAHPRLRCTARAAGRGLRLCDHASQRRRRRRTARPQRALPRARRGAHRERLQRQDPQQGRRSARVRDHGERPRRHRDRLRQGDDRRSAPAR